MGDGIDPLDDEPRGLRAFAPVLLLAGIIVLVALGYLTWRYGPILLPRHLPPPPPPESAVAMPPLGRIAECPRFAPPYAEMPQAKSNADEQRIRALRRLAWQDDFFAQITLADIYRAANSLDQNYQDVQEAAVWLVVALANPEGYQPMARDGIDDCREDERYNADAALIDITSHMSAEDIAAVRDRVIYIFASQGAPGLLKLARIYDEPGYDVYGEPWPFGLSDRRLDIHRRVRRNHLAMFTPRPVDAWLFYFLAAQQGDPMAGLALADFEGRTRSDFRNYATEKAFRWTSPFEYYPPETTARGGIPLSDESYCDPMGPVSLIIHAVPPTVIEDALRDLNYLQGVPVPAHRPNIVGRPGVKFVGVDITAAAARFQGSLRERADGILTPMQMMRLVQIAAVRGSPRAETALAIMYAKGVGTCHGQDYARSYYWFRRAADQGSPSAIYALSRYFDEGVGGVAPQELARSVTLSVASARAGFWPTREELASLLAQAKKEARDP
jgi:TPR repeat protein